MIPAILRRDGLGFDFRTHRTLWAMGQEFRVWAVIRSHPEFDGWLILSTSKNFCEVTTGSRTCSLRLWPNSLRGTASWASSTAAYQKLQALKSRDVRCQHGHCVPYSASTITANRRCSTHSLMSPLVSPMVTGFDLEIQRQKPQHEEPLRAGKRNIGSIRVAKKMRKCLSRC